MDVFSHGIWAGIGASGINKKTSKKINPYFAAFWGVFPDVFAFSPYFLWMIWNRLRGIEVKPMNMEPQNGISLLSEQLYNISHSLVIFSGVFFLVVSSKLLMSRANFRVKTLVPISMFGWLLHILLDIPTHTYEFYPTPVFWPLFGWKFDGFSWGQPWFIALNYSSILLALYFLRWKKQKISIDKS